MKVYLLTHNDYNQHHFVVAESPVEAAKYLCQQLGVEPYFYKAGENGESDQETNISSSGSWEIKPGILLDLSDFWMYFSYGRPNPKMPISEARPLEPEPVPVDLTL